MHKLYGGKVRYCITDLIDNDKKNGLPEIEQAKNKVKTYLRTI